MAYEGKVYKHVKDENFEDFVNNSGLTPEQAAGFLNYKPEQKLVKNGDTYTLVSTTDKGSREISFKNGVEFEETMVFGRSKTTFTLDGNTLTQVQKYDDGVTVTTTRVYTETSLTVTLKRSNYDGPPATRHYTA